MLLSLIELSMLLQPAATSAGGGASAAPAGGGAAGPVGGCAGGAGGMNMVIIPLMFAVFYFLLIRPQQKRQKEQDAMLGALTKGDIVRTTGGIRGEITQLDDRQVTLLVADRTRINVLRSAIAGPERKTPEQDDKK